MNFLRQVVADQTGLSKFDIDAILKVSFNQILRDIREGNTVYLEGFGYFAPQIKDTGLEIEVFLTKSASDFLNKNEQKEKKNEIIFE